MEIESTRKLVVVHGQKGGVGKSVVATLLTELAPSKPLIVECDDSAPDVARRYQDFEYEGVSIGLLSADSPADALSDLLCSVEDAPEKLIVVNLPAAAGTVVDEYAEQIREVADALGRMLIVVFVIGAGQDSVSAAKKCAESGLASVAHRRIAVLNAFHGTPARLGWNSEAKAVWRDPDVILPELAGRVMEHVRSVNAPLMHISSPGNGLYAGDQSLIRRWLRQCQPMVDAVYG